jgi:hypothetical protein
MIVMVKIDYFSEADDDKEDKDEDVKTKIII